MIWTEQHHDQGGSPPVWHLDSVTEVDAIFYEMSPLCFGERVDLCLPSAGQALIMHVIDLKSGAIAWT